MDNRRKFPRRPLYFKTVCVPEKDPYRHLQAEGFDMSAGGIGIKIKQPIFTGSVVKLRITRPFYQDTFEAKGRVAWQAKPDSAGTIRAGIRFTEIPWSKIQPLLH